MRRRDFFTLLGTAAAWPLAARAQQPAMALVGLPTGNQVDDRLIDAAFIERT
jgi:putative tryptophan/tyrosine transport system substrate-binding protein